MVTMVNRDIIMKYILLILCSFLVISCSSQTQTDLHSDTPTLDYPWLATNGKFGYRDASGEMKTQPQYEDARPFQNGYAVVAQNGKYGVINAQNKIVIPIKYPLVSLISGGDFTILVTKKEHNAWWRFWQWKIS